MMDGEDGTMPMGGVGGGGGGIGVGGCTTAGGGGYYQQRQHHNEHNHPHQQQEEQQQYSTMNRERELLGGKILFSFYVSDKPPQQQHQQQQQTPLSSQPQPTPGGTAPSTPNAKSNTTTNKTPGPNLAQDAAPLISSSSNGPFARHDLHPIPTPYGFLHLTALYDSTLDVGDILTKRARRLGMCFRDSSTGSGGTTTTRAIPTNSNHSVPMMDNGGNNMMIGVGDGDSGLQRQRIVSPLDYVGGGDSTRDTVSVNASYRTAVGQGANDMAPQKQNNNNNSNGDERVLSGISLALMNLDQQEQGGCYQQQQQQQQQQKQQQQQEQHQVEASTSLGITLSKSPSSLRQRKAFHHPPPSFGNSTTNTTPSSSYGNSNNNNNNHMHAHHTQAQVGSLSSVGCGRKSPGPSPYMCAMGSSPISIANTPPQPVFLGSIPRRLGGTISTSGGSAPRFPPSDTRGGEDYHQQCRRGSGDTNASLKMSAGTNGGISSPPFRNPLSLQPLQVQGSDAGAALSDDPPKFLTGGVRGSAVVASSNLQQQLYRETNTDGNAQGIDDTDVLLPPLTSLDMLANNPFKGLVGVGAGGGGNFNGSVVSSLSLGMGSTAYYGPNDDSASVGGFASLQSRSCLPSTGEGSDFLFRSGGIGIGGGIGGGGGAFVDNSMCYSSKNESQENYSYDDMPFAVDVDCTTLGSPEGCGGSGGDLPMAVSTLNSKLTKYNSSVEMGMGSSAVISASQVITSLAHRCATAGRLKLFSEDENPAKITDVEPGTGTFETAKGGKHLNNDGSLSATQDGEGTRKQSLAMASDGSVASFASKLAEFHTFEDSLSGGGGESSTLRQNSVAAPCVESS